MDILFWVVIAVVWAIGGIIKAAAAGRKNRKGQSASDKPAKQENFLERLAKKAEQLQRAAEAQGRHRKQRAGHPEPQGQKPRPAEPSKPAPGRVTVRTGRGGQSVLIYERQPSPQPVQQERQRPSRPPAPRADRRRRPKARPVAPSPPREMPAVAPAPKRAAVARSITPGYTSVTAGGALGADYRDTEALRRAILSMEILGKPLALRDPSEQKSQF